MKFLFVLHDAPYGSERTYNGIRWARQLLADEASHEVKVYMFGDAVVALGAGQRTPDGYYNIAAMVGQLVARGADVGGCTTCLDARGVPEDNMVQGSGRSSLAELARWTAWADQVRPLVHALVPALDPARPEPEVKVA